MHQCEHQYCSEQCAFGYVLDMYGCQTCECIDPCKDVYCGKNEVCVNGVCGENMKKLMMYMNMNSSCAS